MKKRIALLLAMALLATGVVGCHTEDMQETEAGQVIYQAVDIADAVAHKDDTSVYEYIGKHITIDMVQEDPETGLAYVTYENTTYELGMDFLSKAMVYNCAIPKDAPQYSSQKQVHQQWWKLYIQRWNYMAPEIPLYSKQDRYVYNTKLENFQPAAYQGVAEAILFANVKDGYTNSASVGSTAVLSGTFRDIYNAHAADGEIAKLTGGYNLVKAEKNGELVWNMAVLESMPQVVKNADGTVTYTMQLRNNLRFSDGTSVTARDYLAPLLVHCGIMGDTTVGETLVGYQEYHVYDGTNHGQNVSVQTQDGEEETVKASKSLSGLKLLGEFSFSVTLVKAYVDHYYALTQMQFAPAPAQMYSGNSEVLVESGGRAYLSQDFYAKTQQDDYVMADILQQNLQWDSQFPYSGAYKVSDYNAQEQTVLLQANPYHAAETAPAIETLVYRTVTQETKMQLLQQGQVDVLAEPLTAEEMETAQALIAQMPERLCQIAVDNAGYGKLALRCDYGPTSMVQVRRAMMYAIEREALNQQLPQGGGELVHGAYHNSHPAYQAVKHEILLNPYTHSVDDAIACLVAGGWVYNEKGQPYTQADTVRYKKLSGYELSEDNLKFKSIDGKYQTLKINGEYYMPLAINWYGTQPNSVTDVLITAWQTNPAATAQLGMYVTYTPCSMEQGVYGELYRDTQAGFDGVPKLNAINIATAFPSAVYDYSWYWSINSKLLQEGYSVSFARDEADYLENYKR